MKMRKLKVGYFDSLETASETSTKFPDSCRGKWRIVRKLQRGEEVGRKVGRLVGGRKLETCVEVAEGERLPMYGEFAEYGKRCTVR